jgi:hypothetical protein
MIHTTIHAQQSYTIHSCFGNISAEQIMEKMTSYYQNQTTKHVIWDFEEASISNLTTEEILELVEFPKQFLHLRSGGLTVIAASEQSSFGVSRMYQSYAEAAQLNTKIVVLRSLKDAVNLVTQTA